MHVSIGTPKCDVLRESDVCDRFPFFKIAPLSRNILSIHIAMLDAHKRFFDFRELADHVAGYLKRPELVHLALTSRKLNRQFTPALYRTVDLRFQNSKKNIFRAIPCLQALARNIRHLRNLTFALQELAFYYNCVLTLKEMNSQNVDDTDAQIYSRPAWLPPPDIPASLLIAMPPMTRLTQLSIHLDFSPFIIYSKPSVKDAQPIAALICWLISSNPSLVRLDLSAVPLMDARSGQLFGDAIAGLSRLKELSVCIMCEREHRFQLGCRVIFSCRSSIQSIIMNFDDEDGRLQDQENTRLKDEVYGDMMVAMDARVQEPLINLKRLFVKGFSGWASAANLRSVFAHCPNVTLVRIPCIPYPLLDTNSNTMGEFVGRACSKINDFTYDARVLDDGLFDYLPCALLEALPAQQLVNFEYRGFFDNINFPGATLALLRHSTTLQSIHLRSKSSVNRISFALIFKECVNLTELAIPRNHPGEGHYITLDDALEYPWACTRLQVLTLSISGCELPNLREVPPYYLRDVPIDLTEEESQHFARLESLYRNIGTLTDITDLTLRMTKLDGNGNPIPPTRLLEPSTYMPAMLSLGSVHTGRPGYLHLLAGLKNIDRLVGSVRANTVEAKRTVEWPEAVWMNEHWPQLRIADFYINEKSVTAPFRWLRDRRELEDRGDLTFAEDEG
ncbi:hypothetical protein BGZ96_012363 [Linnemannia gamsii]|uniref:F-box domain-containing protein n=1 Tax=Linnemannia gamsii TaxID=64522 RepID=A0ABQ7JQI1_9FUNG|nr:hypothetical protein BGZ96_012363 [Linnemannia gamsii]